MTHANRYRLGAIISLLSVGFVTIPVVASTTSQVLASQTGAAK